MSFLTLGPTGPITVAQPLRICTELPAHVALTSELWHRSHATVNRNYSERVPVPVTRLTLVSHATTAAMRRARFNSDEPVDDPGLRQLGHVKLENRADTVLIAPERRTRMTAEGLGLHGPIAPELSDISYGTWAGSSMEDLPESTLASWLTDTSTTPPDGESIDDLFGRVGRWMSDVAADPRRISAVTHPSVIRAVVVRALDAPSSSFWRVDIPPLTTTTLHCRNGRWTLRTVAEKII